MKEFRLPKTIKDLRIKHFNALSNGAIDEVKTLEDVVKFMALFIGCSEQSLLEISRVDLVAMYDHVVNLFEDFKPRNYPPKELTINGKTYYLADPEKVATKWHIDFGISSKNIDKNPVQLACLFYIPEGVYGRRDENGNIINSIKERYIDFELHFPLTTFLECCSFFLQKSQKSITRSTLKKQASQRTVKRLSRKP